MAMKTLIPMSVALFFLILAMANVAKSQTTSFTYDFLLGQPVGISYLGGAHYEKNMKTVRLTKTDDDGNALPNNYGKIMYQKFVPFWAPGKVSDFETTIKFIIKPNPNDNKPPADGLVFFMVPTITTWPVLLPGGNFGIFGVTGNSSATFAVEFDIYPNEWDPPHPHVGIDIQSRISAATEEISNDLIGQVVTLRVNYVGATKKITAVVTSGSQSFEVSYNYDLTTVLHPTVLVGIAGATGANVAIHDVISWYFTSTMYNSFADVDGEYIKQVTRS